VSLPSPFRFAVEAVLLVAVGVALAAADLGLFPFVLLMGAAWILVATGERMLSRPDESEPVVWQPVPARREEPAPVRGDRKPMPELQRPEPERRAAEPDQPEVSKQDKPKPEREPALEVVPEPEPEEPEPEPEEPEVPVVELPQAAHRRPEGWNLWDLERRAHELAGRDPIQDEEWSALFVSLRGYARPDGTLPHEFDVLVKESFGELTSRQA
jgi:outer membrane biosynthesis protein TonB